MIKDLHGGGTKTKIAHEKNEKASFFILFHTFTPEKTKKIYELPDKKFSLKGWGDFSGKYKPMNP